MSNGSIGEKVTLETGRSYRIKIKDECETKAIRLRVVATKNGYLEVRLTWLKRPTETETLFLKINTIALGIGTKMPDLYNDRSMIKGRSICGQIIDITTLKRKGLSSRNPSSIQLT